MSKDNVQILRCKKGFEQHIRPYLKLISDMLIPPVRDPLTNYGREVQDFLKNPNQLTKEEINAIENSIHLFRGYAYIGEKVKLKWIDDQLTIGNYLGDLYVESLLYFSKLSSSEHNVESIKRIAKDLEEPHPMYPFHIGELEYFLDDVMTVTGIRNHYLQPMYQKVKLLSEENYHFIHYVKSKLALIDDQYRLALELGRDYE